MKVLKIFLSPGGIILFCLVTLSVFSTGIVIQNNRLEEECYYLKQALDLTAKYCNTEIRDSLISIFGVNKNDAERYAVILRICSDRFKVDWKKIAAKIQVESGFNPFQVSKVTQIGRDKRAESAYGLMQIKPSTAKEVADKLNIPWREVYIYDEYYNVLLGVGYYSLLLPMLCFDFEKTIKAYNCGLAGFYQGLYSQQHWRKVLYNYKLLNGENDTLLLKIIVAEEKQRKEE